MFFFMMIVDLRTEFWDVLLTTHTVLSIGWPEPHGFNIYMITCMFGITAHTSYGPFLIL